MTPVSLELPEKNALPFALVISGSLKDSDLGLARQLEMMAVVQDHLAQLLSDSRAILSQKAVDALMANGDSDGAAYAESLLKQIDWGLNLASRQVCELEEKANSMLDAHRTGQRG